MTQKQFVGMKMDEQSITSMDAMADKLGINRSQFIIQAVEWMTGFEDPELILMIGKAAKEMEKTPSMLLRAIFVRWLAKRDAHQEVLGYSHKETRLLVNYPSANTEYNLHKSTYTNEFEIEAVRVAAKKDEQGKELTESEEKLLIKYRIGDAWLRSDERYREEEIHKKLTEGGSEDDDEYIE